jgi:cathepsin L
MTLNAFSDEDTVVKSKALNGFHVNATKTCSVHNSRHKRQTSTFINFPPAPPTLDYRNLGFVGPVEDQGYCSSCYAFSANCALEGQIFKKYKTLRNLSEQQLVDCTKNTTSGNWGCEVSSLITLKLTF